MSIEKLKELAVANKILWEEDLLLDQIVYDRFSPLFDLDVINKPLTQAWATEFKKFLRVNENKHWNLVNPGIFKNLRDIVKIQSFLGIILNESVSLFERIDSLSIYVTYYNPPREPMLPGVSILLIMGIHVFTNPKKYHYLDQYEGKLLQRIGVLPAGQVAMNPAAWYPSQVESIQILMEQCQCNGLGLNRLLKAYQDIYFPGK